MHAVKDEPPKEEQTAAFFKNAIAGEWAWVGVIVTVTWFVYGPAMHRLFVADQIRYLAELNGENTLWAGLRHWDYANSRQYWKGDEITFRPLLFTWLAIQNWLFSYHYVWWNYTNLCVHLGVVLLLFRFLLKIQSLPFAGLLALLFSILMPLVELPVWNHLGGYMMGFGLLLIALDAWRELWLAEQGGRKKDLVQFLVAITAGCFFYELLVPISWMMGGSLVVAKRKKDWSVLKPIWFWMALPTLLFGIGYLFHCQHAQRLWYLESGSKHPTSPFQQLLQFPVNVVKTLGFWIGNLLVPSLLSLNDGLYRRMSVSFGLIQNWPILVINLSILVNLCYFSFKAASISRCKKQVPLALLLFGIMLCYAALLVLTRSIGLASYYQYLFCLLFILLTATVLDFDSLPGATRSCAIAALLLFISLNVFLSRRVCQEIQAANARTDRCFSALNAFVAEHRNDPTFTFAIQNPPREVQVRFPFRRGYLDDPQAEEVKIRLVKILYGHRFEEDHPQYNVVLNPD